MCRSARGYRTVLPKLGSHLGSCDIERFGIEDRGGRLKDDVFEVYPQNGKITWKNLTIGYNSRTANDSKATFVFVDSRVEKHPARSVQRLPASQIAWRGEQ